MATLVVVIRTYGAGVTYGAAAVTDFAVANHIVAVLVIYGVVEVTYDVAVMTYGVAVTTCGVAAPSCRVYNSVLLWVKSLNTRIISSSW